MHQSRQAYNMNKQAFKVLKDAISDRTSSAMLINEDKESTLIIKNNVGKTTEETQSQPEEDGTVADFFGESSIDCGLRGFIVQKPLTVSKMVPKQENIWVDIQQYFDIDKTKSENPTQLDEVDSKYETKMDSTSVKGAAFIANMFDEEESLRNLILSIISTWKKLPKDESKEKNIMEYFSLKHSPLASSDITEGVNLSTFKTNTIVVHEQDNSISAQENALSEKSVIHDSFSDYPIFSKTFDPSQKVTYDSTLDKKGSFSQKHSPVPISDITEGVNLSTFEVVKPNTIVVYEQDDSISAQENALSEKSVIHDSFSDYPIFGKIVDPSQKVSYDSKLDKKGSFSQKHCSVPRSDFTERVNFSTFEVVKPNTIVVYEQDDSISGRDNAPSEKSVIHDSFSDYPIFGKIVDPSQKVSYDSKLDKKGSFSQKHCSVPRSDFTERVNFSTFEVVKPNTIVVYEQDDSISGRDNAPSEKSVIHDSFSDYPIFGKILDPSQKVTYDAKLDKKGSSEIEILNYRMPENSSPPFDPSIWGDQDDFGATKSSVGSNSRSIERINEKGNNIHHQVMKCPKSSVNKAIEPMVRSRIKQQCLLGRKTVTDNFRHFSTCPVLGTMTQVDNKDAGTMTQADNKDSGAMTQADKLRDMAEKAKVAECRKQEQLPCIRVSEIMQNLMSKGSPEEKRECLRYCLPCCRPARDPPTCHLPYHKQPCKRARPPRPSFSECKKDKVKGLRPCECLLPTLPRCKMGKSQSSKGCSLDDM